MDLKKVENGTNIRISENNCGHLVHISFHRTFKNIYTFLQSIGYRLEPWDWYFEDTTFPGGTSVYNKTIFVALKPGEIPSEDKIYTAVFERELRKIFAHI